MVRWNWILAGGLLLLAGCGQSGPQTPDQRAHHALNKGDYQEAIAICNEAIANNPEDAEAYLYRGRAHHFRNQPGDLELAIKDFGESIRLAPKKPEAYLARSLAYRDHGDAEKSAEDDQKARELDESLKEVYAAMPDAPTSKLARVKGEEEPAEKPATDAAPMPPLISTPTEPAQPEAEDSTGALLRRPNFGTTGSTPGSGGAGNGYEAQAESERTTRQRQQLLSKPTFRLPTATRPTAQPAAELEEEAAPSGSGAGGLPPSRGTAGGASGDPRGAAPTRRKSQPPADGWGSEPGPISPWATRGTSGVGAPPAGRSSTVQSPFAPRLDSPFPQAPPRPTGLVETPQNPFAPTGPAARTPPSSLAPPVPQVNVPGLRDDF